MNPNTIPALLLLESLLSNPDIMVLVDKTGQTFIAKGMKGESPRPLGEPVNHHMRDMLASGHAVRVLSPNFCNEHLPLGMLITVVAKHRKPEPHLLYNEALGKDFHLLEHLVLQRILNIPQWNFGPLGIWHLRSAAESARLSQYVWVTNSGSGHIDLQKMSADEICGVKRLVKKGVLIETVENLPFFGVYYNDIKPDMAQLQAYI